jgi:hypothetical protein
MAKVIKPFRFNGQVVHPGDNVEPEPGHRLQLEQAGMIEASAPPRIAKKAKKVASKPTASKGVVLKGGVRPASRRPVVGK